MYTIVGMVVMVFHDIALVPYCQCEVFAVEKTDDIVSCLPLQQSFIPFHMQPDDACLVHLLGLLPLLPWWTCQKKLYNSSRRISFSQHASD